MFLAHFLPLGLLEVKINSNKADSFFRLHFNVYVHEHWPFSHWRRIIHLSRQTWRKKLHRWIKSGGLAILNLDRCIFSLADGVRHAFLPYYEETRDEPLRTSA